MIRLFRVEQIMLGLSIAILPFYVFPSGNVQPGHLGLFIFSVTFFFHYGLPINSWSLLFVVALGYVFFVESVYTILGNQPNALINGAYFLYNLIVVLAIYGFCKRYGAKPVFVGFTIAMLLTLAVVMVSGVDLSGSQSAGRKVALFNNPNQLGFFSVCSFSISYVLYRAKKFKYIYFVFFVVLSIFLSILSLSKAAMVSLFVLSWLALKPNSLKSTFFWVPSLLLCFCVFYWLFVQGVFEDFFFVNRLLGMATESDSSLEARGYLAFLSGDTVQLIFGLGADNAHNIIGHETHSTLWSMFNKYGLLGFVVFTGLMFIWIRYLWQYFGLFGAVCIVGAPMLYGLTHNGTRFTFFWILFALSLAIANRERYCVKSECF